MQLLLVTVAFFAVLVIQFAAGNLISVYWPQRIELTKMNTKIASNTTGVASLVIMLAISALGRHDCFCCLDFPTPLAASAGAAWRFLPPVSNFISWLLDRAARYTWEHLKRYTQAPWAPDAGRNRPSAFRDSSGCYWFARYRQLPHLPSV